MELHPHNISFGLRVLVLHPLPVRRPFAAAHGNTLPMRHARRQQRQPARRFRVPPCQAMLPQEQQQQQRQQQTADSPASAAPQEPRKKLGRFSGKNDIRVAMLNFRDEVEVEGGTLVIKPLTADRLREATDLLTTVFAATDGRLGIYTTFMRGQIRTYLENHLQLVPNAIVLIATLQPAAAAKSSTDSRSSSSSSSSSSGNSSSAASAAAEPRPQSQAAANGPAVDHSGTDSQPVSDAVPGVAAADSASRTRSRDEDDGPLVGTVEMAFTDETRTRFLTLNPPSGSAYLGNMCTEPAYRRRGYAAAMLRAAERLTRLAHYPEIYLHLRFKDEGAGVLYEQAGYNEVQRDSFWRLLLGLDQRYLMSKTLMSGKE